MSSSGGEGKTIIPMATVKKKHIKPARMKAKIFCSNEPLLSVFMWGINHTINELSHVNIPVMLLSDDFKAFTKTRVDNHLFNKDSMPSHFKIKEYCPLVFRNLRERFNIDDNAYMKSLTKSQPCDTESPGRSGARFLKSFDSKYVIKFISSEEVEEMHHLLKQYHEYIVNSHGDTLLPQYLGMYRLTVENQEHYVLVQRNIFSHRLKVHKKYDLKGSTVDRKASDKEKAKDLPTYKDVDFVADGVKLAVGLEAKDRIMDIIKRDVELLCALHLMDYSLLVGIHDVERAAQDAKEEANGVQGQEEDGAGGDEEEDEDTGDDDMTPPDSPAEFGQPPHENSPYAVLSSDKSTRQEYYYMGIIDVLTRYGMRKRAANAAKTVKHGANAEISTVAPDLYAKRFLDFIDQIMEAV